MKYRIEHTLESGAVASTIIEADRYSVPNDDPRALVFQNVPPTGSWIMVARVYPAPGTIIHHDGDA